MNLIRQSFLGEHSQEVIERSRIAVVGLCGGGSHVAQQLAHIGFRNLVLVDHDKADDSNLNRMVGLTASDVEKGTLKTSVVGRNVVAINPNASPEMHSCYWQECQNALKDCDAIFGCVDSFAQREQLERFCRRLHIAYIDVGMDVFGEEGDYFISGQSIVSLPGHACMRCMGFLSEDVLAREAAKYGAAGGKPQVVWPNGTLASMAIGQFMGIFTAWHPRMVPPLYLDYDGNRSMVTPNKRLAFLKEETCPHFQGADALGDLRW